MASIRGDYKLTVNKAIRTNLYPIQRIEDLCGAISGRQLNLKHVYNYIRLHEMPRVSTTINICRRLFVYTRLPFGVSFTRGIFHCLIYKIVKDISHVFAYLDDVLITE